jgi:AcrR family transcriptional regulator
LTTVNTCGNLHAMGRRPGKRYHHGDLRRALLDATLRLAAERSPAGVSLRESAREAGVSPAAPYRHFPDKQNMLAAASEEGFRMLLDRVGQSVRQATSPVEQIIEWVGVYVQFAAQYPAHFRLMWGQGSPPKSTTVELQAVARETFQAFHKIVTDLVGPWKLKSPESRAVTLAIWSIAHGAATLALDGQTQFLGIPIERVHEIARMSVRGYLAGLRRTPPP